MGFRVSLICICGSHMQCLLTVASAPVIPFGGFALLTRVRLRLAMYRGYGYGWEFLFLGANIDAIETARHIGIDADHAADYCCDSAGTAVNYECLNKAVTAFRCAAPIGAAWKKDIEEDYKRRKK